MNTRGLAAALIGTGLVAVLVVAAPALRPTPPEGAHRGDCGPGLTRAHLDTSLELGAAFMMANQKPAGNFGYEWDWAKGVDNPDDNEVRQAGATWGLALILHDDPSRTDVRDALLKAFDFWDAQAQDFEGRRVFFYQGGPTGGTGTLALMTLAIIEVLRSDAELPPGKREQLQAQLDAQLDALVALRLPDGGFASSIRRQTGSPSGKPNPYADGEALLAMVKAARYLGRADRLDTAVAWAVEDRERNVVRPRAAERDPDTTKGYYQWVSMAWHELAGSTAADRHPWGEWLMELAVWMIDDHRTLQRTRNTGYAYEGIISAWAWAEQVGDPRAETFRCVIDQGMRKITSWQIGHPLANDFARKAPASDVRARGGAMNEANKAPLRIDTTQHQMHAVILARRYGVGR